MPDNTVLNHIQRGYSIHGLLRLNVLDRTGIQSDGFIQKQLSPFLIEGINHQPDLVVSQEKDITTCSILHQL